MNITALHKRFVQIHICIRLETNMSEPIIQSNSTRNSEEAAAYERSEHSVHNVVVEELQQRIRQGSWLPGERMPSIAQLAKEFHVGAGSMREALRSLQSIGLVKIEHGSGVFVTGSRASTELSSHFQKAGSGLHIALAETRRVLEPELAALAAERGTQAELGEIEELVKKMEKEAQNGGNFAELDMLFHRTIAQAARNPILYQTIESVSDLFLEFRRTIMIDPNSLLRALRYHALIAEALKVRNAPQARLLMQGHMNSILEEILASEAFNQAGEETQNIAIQETL
jgi:GntR family transcriptional repressor for pyruvate dehydrogenase complex